MDFLKTLSVVAMATTLLFALSSCEKGDPGNCYKGEVIVLAQGGDDCFDFIQILSSVRDGIPKNAKLSFSSQYIYDTYGKTLKKGDIIYFKITNYKKYEMPAAGYCFPPDYILIDGPMQLCQ